MTFSKPCPGCLEYSLEHSTDRLCPACIESLGFIEAACGHCGIATHQDQPYCGHCLKKRYAFDSLHACFEFAFPIQSMLHRFKYNQAFAFGEIIIHYAATHLETRYANEPLPDLILPIPLHPKKQRQRGFNQALEIAKRFGERLDRPVGSALKKVRYTESQSMLPHQERQKNIRNAFSVTGDMPKYIALVDDVATTCATVHEAAKALKANGVERVDVWCLARTP